MDILPIQASSVPCERVFSSSKETTTARRNKLNLQVVEALQVLKFEHKHNKILSFTAGLDGDEEMLELEAIEEAQPTDDPDGLVAIKPLTDVGRQDLAQLRSIGSHLL
jgi:predicted HAD superfamily hydrolase